MLIQVGQALSETPPICTHVPVYMESPLCHHVLLGVPAVRSGNDLEIRINQLGTFYWSSLLSRAIILVLGLNRFN